MERQEPGIDEHCPVLVKEVLENLNIKPEGNYLDCTFGRGGHAQAILRHLDSQGRLIAMDKDFDAVLTGQKLAETDQRFQIEHGSFTKMKSLLQKVGLDKKVNGILLDLGVSSPQLNNPLRGFSFMQEGPLDMRMNTTTGLTLSSWLATVKEHDLADVIFQFGEERYARRIARGIVTARVHENISTTTQLAKIIQESRPKFREALHPATRTFQALRIFINNELSELQTVLPMAVDVLAEGGRLLVISFHSLEDRIVKRFFRAESRAILPDTPFSPSVTFEPRLAIVQKIIRPSKEEVQRNPRSRSAVLRVAERLG